VLSSITSSQEIMPNRRRPKPVRKSAPARDPRPASPPAAAPSIRPARPVPPPRRD